MEVVPAQEFLRFTFEEIDQTCFRSVDVLFEDGVLQLTPNEIKFNRIIWDIFSVLNNIPIRKKHSITSHYVSGIFTGGCFLKTLESIYEDVLDVYCRPTYSRLILNDYLFEKFQDIYNEVYNKIACRNLQYCTSVDALDFLEIQFKDEVINALKELNKNKSDENIYKAYSALDKVIKTDPSLVNNIVRKGYISGNFKPDQIKQILGPRGFVTELNSELFQEPVCSPLALGLRSNYEIAVESRTAAKALHVSHQAIEQSEYLARTFQLVTMRMQRLVDGDCGSTEYLNWYLDPDPVIGKSELNYLVGKYYLDEETNTLKAIKITDQHLLGKTLKLRSPVHCKHPDSKCICLTCLGEIGYGIPYSTNIGHLATVEFTERMTQSILSYKHQTASSKSINFELGKLESTYLVKTPSEGLGLNIKNYNTKKYKYELIIRQGSAIGLSGLNKHTKVESLVTSKITRIDDLVLRITDKNGNERYEPLQIAFSKNVMKKKKTSYNSKVFGHFTTNFLKYAICGYKDESILALESGTDQYIINLNPWINNPSLHKEFPDVIEYPKLEYSFLQLTKEVKGSISSRGMAENLGDNENSIEAFIQNMFNLLNYKLNVNLALIEIVCCAFIVKEKNKDGGDAHVGRGYSNVVASLNEIINHISLGVSYAFERHKTSILTPATFEDNNVNHILDVLLMPQEVMEDVERGGRY